MVGAYYFDGWSGKTDEIHITKLLTTEYADRKPVWGWKDDTVEIMQKQIDYCADHDIAFWAFDWYYPEGKTKTTPLNNALDLYLKAPNCQRLKFCLLVANHEGFRIGPKDWDACCDKWIELFQKPTHLRLDGQPLLIFLSPDELQKAFGGVDGVRKAFDSLRDKAKKAGLPGVSIAACTGPGGHLGDLARSGYTLLTGYNYPLGWLNGGGSQPFRKLIEGSERIFDQFAEQTPLPYVPAITAGWDRRPWEQGQMPPEKMSVWYPDRTPKLVEEFVRLGVRWMDKHPDKTTPQRLLLIYAWNENGEGGYLTPTAKDGTEYLKAVQRAIAEGEMPWVRVADDKHGFVLSPSGKPFVPWGFNYDHDEERPPAGGLLGQGMAQGRRRFPGDEAAWGERGSDPPSTRQVHDRRPTSRTKRIWIALDVWSPWLRRSACTSTSPGLACYRKKDVPKWYDRLGEKERWDVQGRFWEAVAAAMRQEPGDLLLRPDERAGRARRHAGSPATGWGRPSWAATPVTSSSSSRWNKRNVPGPKSPANGVTSWRTAIRKHDQRHLVTVGLVPWSLDRPGSDLGLRAQGDCPRTGFHRRSPLPREGQGQGGVGYAVGLRRGQAGGHRGDVPAELLIPGVRAVPRRVKENGLRLDRVLLGEDARGIPEVAHDSRCHRARLARILSKKNASNYRAGTG